MLPHLRSKSFDTRAAAALALEQIARAVPLWSPPVASAAVADADAGHVAAADDSNKPRAAALAAPASLAPIDLPALLAPERPKLLASSGKEFALASAGAGVGGAPLSAAELKRSKDEVMRRMGIALPGGLDDGLGAFVDDEMVADEHSAGALEPPMPSAGSSAVGSSDGLTTPRDGASPTLTAAAVPPPPPPVTPAAALPRGKRQREQFEREEERRQREAEDEAFRGLSARQINALKRKRKASGGQAVIPSTTTGGPGGSKAPRLDSPLSAAPSPAPSPAGSPRAASSTLSAAVVIDPQAKAAAAAAAAAAAGGAVDPTTGKADWTTHLVVPRSSTGAERWPFEKVVDQLLVGLFSPAWEIRHGACLGLRELIKLHGAAAGRVVDLSPAANAEANAERLLGLAHAVLTLLALDRFGDFNADQLVAPVRETAGQALASILVHLPANHVGQVHAVLVGMVRQEWLETPSSSSKSSTGSRRAKGYAWEVRHAGLLGLKYEVAVRADLFGAADAAATADLSSSGIVDVKVESIVDPLAQPAVIKLEPQAANKDDVKREPAPEGEEAEAAERLLAGPAVKQEAGAAPALLPGMSSGVVSSIDLLRDVVDAAVLG